MKAKSIWLEELEPNYFPPLKKDIEVDVLIIGGGIMGLSTFYELLDSNLKVCLVEGRTIGSGTTGKSTAKVNYLQGIVYSKIMKDVSILHAKKYLEANLLGINLLKNIIEENHFACDFTPVSSYVYANKKNSKNLEEEYQFLQANKINVLRKDNYLKVFDTYTIHPLKYLNALKRLCYQKNKLIFENSLIHDLKYENNYFWALGDNFKIKARKVVLSCHYPFSLFPYFLPLKTTLEKSYVMVTKEAIKDFTSITTYPNILSKRYYKDYLITLKNSHNIATKLNSKENFSNLINSNPLYLWSNEDIMTPDHLPLIGEIKPNLYLITGFNTWGFALSRVGGMIIKDLILNQENEYIKYFDPLRKLNLSKIKKYPVNVFLNTFSFIENKLFKKKNWYPKDLVFSKYHGKSIATYKGHSVYTTCPHMGCTLNFNEIEQTWDCPCHASRFSLTGKCIKGPSTYSITVKKD